MRAYIAQFHMYLQPLSLAGCQWNTELPKEPSCGHWNIGPTTLRRPPVDTWDKTAWLRGKSLKYWNEEWDKSEKGKWTKEVLPVAKEHRNAICFMLNMALTGHLHRIRKRSSPACPCGVETLLTMCSRSAYCSRWIDQNSGTTWRRWRHKWETRWWSCGNEKSQLLVEELKKHQAQREGWVTTASVAISISFIH